MDLTNLNAQDVSVDTLFETAMRGYHKKQVEDYIAWLQEQTKAAQSEAESARREVDRARDEAAAVKTQLANRPAHEEISERLSQILRLAAEEADQKVAKASTEAEGVLAAANQEAGLAAESARSEADAIVSQAREQGDRILAQARSESERLVSAATADARAKLADASQRAERVLSDTDRRTKEITDLQNERLATLLEVHADSVKRLDTIRGVLASVLSEEKDAGYPGASISDAPLPVAGKAMTADEAGAGLLLEPAPVEPASLQRDPVEPAPAVQPSAASAASAAEVTSGAEFPEVIAAADAEGYDELGPLDDEYDDDPLTGFEEPQSAETGNRLKAR
jgi:cell division septum initiation protein DivIVA